MGGNPSLPGFMSLHFVQQDFAFSWIRQWLMVSSRLGSTEFRGYLKLFKPNQDFRLKPKHFS